MYATKQVKSTQDNNTNNEDESTRHLHEPNLTKIPQTQLPPPQTINYLSLRHRYGSLSDQYPLPLKFEQLLLTMRNIEETYWKKRKPLLYDLKTSAFKILQIGQLLNLDKELYQIKIIDKSLSLTPNDIPTENLPNYHPFQATLPSCFESRISEIRGKLNNLVQVTHSDYLKIINQEDFDNLSKQFKLYHPTFDLNKVSDILPIQLPFKIYSEQQRQELKQIIEIIVKYFNQRTVTFMYFTNLVSHIMSKIKITKEYLEKSILFLLKAQPDFLQITNKQKEANKSKWIIQINKHSTAEQQIESLSTYFY